MKYLLLLGGTLLASTAQAQTTFSIGPRVGLNLSSAHFPARELASHEQYTYSSRPGFEAGLTSTVQFGHFAVQPSLLFSQKGYRSTGDYIGFDTFTHYEEEVRLNYLTLPLSLAFTLRRDGQGLQVFAGPYASLLVGGNFARQVRGFADQTGRVKAASLAPDADYWYSRRFDAGLQAGIGYRLKQIQLQASYSMGLRDLASQFQAYDGTVYRNNPTYYNRAGQVSLSYLFSKG